jgi:hypothetical protein
LQVLFPKATRGFEPISYRGVLASALLHATVNLFLHNLLNVLVQIANKMGLQKKTTSYSRDSGSEFQPRDPPSKQAPAFSFPKVAATDPMRLTLNQETTHSVGDRARARCTCSSCGRSLKVSLLGPPLRKQLRQAVR